MEEKYVNAILMARTLQFIRADNGVSGLRDRGNGNDWVIITAKK